MINLQEKTNPDFYNPYHNFILIFIILIKLIPKLYTFTIFKADEDHDDGDERWDPDSDMDIDVERYFALS